MNKKNILLTVIMLTAFITTSILALLTAKKITKFSVTRATPDTTPDFFMANTIYTKFNSDGQINNSIKAQAITHFPTNNVYFFQKPSMVIYQPHEKPWRISANQGKSEEGKTKVFLWDQVKIVRAAGIHNMAFDITTDVLTIYPDIKFAETKLPITIVQSGSTTQAVGAEADFKTGIIKLVSKVKSKLHLE